MVFNSSLQALKSNPYLSVFVSFLLQSTKVFHKVELIQAEDGFSLHAVPFQQGLYTKVYLILRLSQNLQQRWSSGEKEETLRSTHPVMSVTPTLAFQLV